MQSERRDIDKDHFGSFSELQSVFVNAGNI